MHFECRNDKLSLLKISSRQIIDNNIRIQDNLLEERNLFSLNLPSLTSITLRTPAGTFILLLGIVVPTIRLGLSGWRLSFLRRATKCCAKEVLRLETKYLVGWYGGGALTTGGFYYSAISYKFKSKTIQQRSLPQNQISPFVNLSSSYLKKTKKS